MKIAKATLVKRISNDGLIEVCEHAKIGTVYDVDIDSITEASLYNLEKHLWHKKTIILIDGKWFPLELLKLEGD